MIKRVLFFLAFLPVALFAQDKSGYKIEVTVDNFDGQEMYMAYYLLDKQYILDTVSVDENGLAVFEGETPLNSGMYLIVLPPDNRYFQVLINEGDQHLQAFANNPTDPGSGLKIENSKENTLFYDYLDVLTQQRPKATKIRTDLETASDSDKERLEAELEVINNAVLDYQTNLIESNPTSLTAALIKANMPLDMPEFEGEDAQVAQWQWTKAHYFDNIDLSDPRMLRMPFLFQRVDHYIQKLTVQHPDSLNKSLYTVLEGMRPAEESFKHYLVHYVNEYAGSKIIGFDGIYVFLVDTYYATGLTPWTEEEQKAKMIDNANTLRNLLIGKIAPDISCQDKEGNEYTLHTFESKYTILFFWDPGCGHCKKSMPAMIELYNNYKDKGVEIFAVCTKFYNDMESCWDMVEEKEIGIWLNTIDPYHRSKYKTIYDIKTTPQIYLLDSDKKILSKRLSVEQIPDILDQLLLENEKEPGGSK